MPFLPNIPGANDYIALSQVQMLGNNHVINQAWGLAPEKNRNVGDHVSLENGPVAQLGRHKKTTYPSQGSDPTTGADELALYSKQVSSTTELVYREPSDGTVNQLTNRNALFNGLSLAVYAVFDGNGNIINASRPDSEGNLVDTPMSFNVSSITKTANVDAWQVNFTNALPTNNYFCVISQVNKALRARFVALETAATYGASASTTFVRLSAYSTQDGLVVSGSTARVTLQIYRI